MVSRASPLPVGNKPHQNEGEPNPLLPDLEPLTLKTKQQTSVVCNDDDNTYGTIPPEFAIIPEQTMSKCRFI